MIGNEMYDNSTGEVFRAFAEENDTILNEPKWWQDVHPIWVDAINQVNLFGKGCGAFH